MGTGAGEPGAPARPVKPQDGRARHAGARWGAALVLSAVAAGGAWWWLSAGGSGGGAGGGAAGTGGSPAPSTAAPGAGRAPGVHTAGIHLVASRRGERQWELRAERIDLPQGGPQVIFSRVSEGVFYRQGDVFLLFEGDGGRYDEKTGHLVLAGAVILKDRGGGELSTSDLTWDPGRQVLSTEAPTTLMRGSSALRASRMEVDVQAGVVRLSGGVRAEDPEAGGLTVQAAGAEYVPETGEIRLVGPARLEVRPAPPDG